MKYEVELISEAQRDYKKLDGSIKKIVNKKIDELSDKPFLGERLGNKNSIDLSEFYRIYVARKSIRIVYRLLTPEKIEIIEIWEIGKREKEEIYKIIWERIKNSK